MQLDREVANGFQRTGGHNDFGFLHIKALLGERFGDIRIGDRAKQAAIDTSLLCDLHHVAFEFLGTRVRSNQDFAGFLFQLSTLGFELGLGSVGCTLCFAVRDQKVAGVAVFDFDDITERTQVDDFFHQNNLHDFLLRSLTA